MGCATWRDSTRLIRFMMPGPLGSDQTIGPLDHSQRWYGDFQMYRNGEYVLTHPIGYGNINPTPLGNNVCAFYGLGSMSKRQIIGWGSGPGFMWILGRTYGSYYSPGYHQPPQQFLDWKRLLVYLDPDVILTRDEWTLIDPRTLSDWGRYRPVDQAIIQAAPAPMEWICHCPVRPNLSGTLLGEPVWTTAGGQQVNIQFLEAPVATIVTYDEKLLWGAANENGLISSEKLYHFRAQPTASPLMTVISVGSLATVTQNADGSLTVNGRTISFDVGPAIQ